MCGFCQGLGPATRFRSTRRGMLAVSLLVLAFLGSRVPVLAQLDADRWQSPVNLSHSGAASDPVVVVLPDGGLRVFWWDRYEGVMVADGTFPPSGSDGEGWSAPQSVPILLVETVERGGQEEEVFTPIEAMPRIVGGVGGAAHAFWLGEPDEETGEQPLLYSRLAPGETTWLSPRALAQSASSLDVTVDASGTLHLAYIRPLQTPNIPSGLYYHRSTNGGGDWSERQALHLSRYLRLLSPEEEHLRLSTDEAGGVYVAWDDPRHGQVMLAYSADGGEAWEEPRELVGSDRQPRQGGVVAAPGSSPSLLWDPLGTGQSAIAISSLGDVLTLSNWDGERWSETRQVIFRFEDPELGAQIFLADLEIALLGAVGNEEPATGRLAVTGVDRDHEIWFTGSSVSALEEILALPGQATPVSQGEQVEASASAPVNLSQSGAASVPVIVSGPEDVVRAFWWDRFDGLVASTGRLWASSVMSGTEELVAVQQTWSEPRPVPLAAATMPRMVADGSGQVHAFWLDELSEEQDTGSLLHSRLVANGTAWSSPTMIAESALAFDVQAGPSGDLHLVYLDTWPRPYSPAGLYYRRTGSGETRWTNPTPILQSRYLRLLDQEGAHVRLAVDEEGGIWVAWDDPYGERSMLAHSSDGGSAWQAPKAVGDVQERSRRARPIAVPGGETLVLWETSEIGGKCNLYQAMAGDLLAEADAGGALVLEGLVNCPQGEKFVPLGAGQILLMDGGGTDALTLAAWDGERWSEPAWLSFGFDDPELGRRVYLDSVQAALIEAANDPQAGGSVTALAAVGTDWASDVWATSSQVDVRDMVFAPPPAWSVPVAVSGDETSPHLPAIAADVEGGLHLLWAGLPAAGEPGMALVYARGHVAESWTQPVQVLQLSEGQVAEPSLAAAADRLHAVWSGGSSGKILYSQAFSRDAAATGRWSEPQSLPASVDIGSWPTIAAGSDGGLHVLYAVPLNEARGIYYTQSQDGGSTWRPARQVFDAAGAGWVMADYARLAVGSGDSLHAVWLRTTLSGSDAAEGVYYAHSLDGGETWSEPLENSGETYAWPQVAASQDGRVHLVWNEVGDQPAWWYRESLDSGQTWALPERIPGSETVFGPVYLATDTDGALHLVGLGRDAAGSPALHYWVSGGQNLTMLDTVRLDLDRVEPGVSAVVGSTLDRLDVIVRGEKESTEGNGPLRLWHTGRQSPEVDVMPLPTVRAEPAETPISTPMPTATPAPAAGFDGAPPPASSDSLPIPLPVFLAAGLAGLIVVAVLGVRLLWASRR